MFLSLLEIEIMKFNLFHPLPPDLGNFDFLGVYFCLLDQGVSRGITDHVGHCKLDGVTEE